MSATNSITLVGYVAQEPKIWEKDDRPSVGSFSIGVNEREWSKEDERMINVKNWFDLVGFNRMASAIQSVVKVGRTVAVEGRLKRDKFEKDGQTQYRYQVEITDINVVDWGDKNGSSSEEESENVQEEPTIFPF